MFCLHGLSLAPCLKRICWVWEARCRWFCSEDLPADPARLRALARRHSVLPSGQLGSSFFCPAVLQLGQLLTCFLLSGRGLGGRQGQWGGGPTACPVSVFLPPLPRGGPPAGHLATTGFPGIRGWISSECCWHHTSVTSLASSALLGEG